MDPRFHLLPSRPTTAFLGSPKEAATVLDRLIAAHMAPRVVLTNPDARRSRKGSPSPTPVAQVALDAGIKVIHDPGDLINHDFDLGIVVAYGKMLRSDLLAQAPFVNIHFSLLPRWRGAAPVERAILAGDTVTGVSLMEVGPRLDEGAVFASRRVPIDAGATAAMLRRELAELGAQMLIGALDAGEGAFGSPVAQDGEATYAKKLVPGDLRVDFTQSAELIARQVAVGGAWCMLGQRRVKIIEAEAFIDEAVVGDVVDSANQKDPGSFIGGYVICGNGYLRIDTLQLEGRNPTAFEAWQRGNARSQGELKFA